MRLLSVNQIKKRNKGKRFSPLQQIPSEGTRIREVYDALMSSIGKPICIQLDWNSDGRSLAAAINQLKIFYGLDIRLLRPENKSRSLCALHAVVGEWFGKIYVDYTCESEEQMELLLKVRETLVQTERTENILPEGVHNLSKKDMDTLRRIAEKGAAIMEKHLKRGP